MFGIAVLPLGTFSECDTPVCENAAV